MSRGMRARPFVLVSAIAALLMTGVPSATGTGEVGDLGQVASESSSVVEVHVANRAELEALIATGVDLDHQIHHGAQGIGVHAVVTPNEAASLEDMGFDVGEVLYDAETVAERVAEREATIEAHIAENEAFAAAAYDSTSPEISDVRIVRADYYTSFGTQILSVEAKWAGGQTSSQQLTVERDSGPGTPMGSGGSDNISRFVDAGVYLYHRGTDVVDTRPEYVRIESPTGDVAVAKVNDWLMGESDPEAPPLTDFITSYLTPTELYERIEQLAAEFPEISEIVELPYETNGYRRKAQALLDPPPNRVVVDGPSSAAGEYGFAGPAGYGPDLPTAGLSGSFALVNDGSGLPTEGCEPLVGFPAGSIALVDRGTCPFVQKTQNAQAAGATGVIIMNNVGGAPFSPGGSASGITISTVMISLDDGNALKAGLPATGTLIPGGSISNNQRVGVDSIAWGHEGGNDLTIASVDPGAASSPLSVDVSGDDITVNLGTDAGGSLSSTAADVAAAINADPAASALLFAYTYRGSSGSGIAQPSPRRNLSDFLSAPDSVPDEPRTVKLLRIGKHRDGSKPGVFAYAQEHAREWVPPLVAIETAERLLQNYQEHGPTKQLVNRLDIFILPSTNPDGGEYAFYDDNGQRRNMTRHCEVDGAYDLNARNAWGVDNNRNYDQYSLFDGYSGASTSCTSDVFAGPAELSEPESANIDWVADTFDNIEFSMNLHSSGNYFMWSPGSYALPGRISAPRPTLGEESFFWGASSRILTAIKQHRGLSVTPARTGPISDVLYSAAGNSGDMLWYKYGIYAWNFEVGTQFQPPFENPNPNGASGHAESQEFANGLVELVRVAHDFDRDHEPPVSSIKVTPAATPEMVNVVFETTEPAAVFYTTDGSRPTYDSTLYASGGVREGGELLTVPAGTMFHFFSVDSAGNVENNYNPAGNAKNYNKATASP